MTGEIETALERVREIADVARDAVPEAYVRAASAPFARALPETLDPAERRRLVERIEELKPWYQGPFPLGGDLVIEGQWRADSRWQMLAARLPDLAGKRVLDVGSNAGYDPFSFMAAGAAEVVACEPFFVDQMRFLEGIYRTGVTITASTWQQLDAEQLGTFHLVHCNGVFYHEMHPAAMLERLRTLMRDDGVLLLGSMMLASAELAEYARFVPGAYGGDRSWWWVPGRLALRWMLEAVGFDVEETFGLTAGPAGHFPVVNGYFRARLGEPSPELTRP